MSFAKPARTGSTSFGPGMGWRTKEKMVPDLVNMILAFFFHSRHSPCLRYGIESSFIRHVALLQTRIHPWTRPDVITRDGWTPTRFSPMATIKKNKTQTIISLNFVFVFEVGSLISRNKRSWQIYLVGDCRQPWVWMYPWRLGGNGPPHVTCHTVTHRSCSMRGRLESKSKLEKTKWRFTPICGSPRFQVRHMWATQLSLPFFRILSRFLKQWKILAGNGDIFVQWFFHSETYHI